MKGRAFIGFAHSVQLRTSRPEANAIVAEKGKELLCCFNQPRSVREGAWELGEKRRVEENSLERPFCPNCTLPVELVGTPAGELRNNDSGSPEGLQATGG